MHQSIQQPSVPIPPDFMDLANAHFESIGLGDLPASVKYAFAQDVYPRYLDQVGMDTAAPLWTPITKAQRLAQLTLADETFFGGRAGCGKTYLLLGIGCTEHNESILFRQEYSQLKDIIKKSRVLLSGTGASYNGTDKIWSNIPSGRTLEFGACKYDDDVEKFRGREHDLLAFDEVATFREDHYLDLCGWARTTDKEQRVRILAAGNPPFNPEDFWVKKRWAAWLDETHHNQAKPGELRWYARIDDKDTEVDGPEPFMHNGEEITPLSRTFIPGEAMLDSLKNTGYEARLQGLREPLRSQLLYGDFSIGTVDKERQVIPTAWVRAAQRRWEEMTQPTNVLRALGVDVARGGSDQTIISKRYRNWFARLLKYDASETRTGGEVAALVMKSMEAEEMDGEEMRSVPIILDLTGVGSSPYDILTDNEFNVDGFVASSKSAHMDAAGRLEFTNRRAEAWWKFYEALDPDSGEDIALPPDPELMADLTAPTWELVGNGIRIEKKDAIKKRIGRSPDCGDAVVMNYNADTRSAANVSYF